jgi:hypothetical protein
MTTLRRSSVLACSVLAGLAGLGAEAADPAVKQVVKPPVAQAWIDVATFSGFGMGPGAMNMSLGQLMSGTEAKAEFGNTVTGVAGRWMDVTLYTSRNLQLAEALQGVPNGTRLAPTLQLQTPERPKPPPADNDEPADFTMEPPKGKLVLYWGCGETARPGQPKVLDLSTATIAELGKFFESRRATRRGAHAAAGRPVWPSKADRRALPDGASLVGEHSYQGQGVPESFKFTIPPAQDIMPAMKVRQTPSNGAVILEWEAIPHARAYFLGTMGALPGGGDTGMVLWTSSELPDSGLGLFDYQTNVAVDGWLKDKVLLAPATTRCTVPKEVAAGQGMLRAIAYGTELNMAYPPRPADPAIAWEPDWNVKVRVKSMTTSMLGMEGDMPGMPGMGSEGEVTEAPPPSEPGDAEAGSKPKKKFGVFDALKDAAKKAVP